MTPLLRQQKMLDGSQVINNDSLTFEAKDEYVRTYRWNKNAQ